MKSLDAVAILGTLLGVIVVVVALIRWAHRKRSSLAPRDRRRFDRKFQIFNMAMMTSVAAIWFYQGQMVPACLFAVACVFALYGVMNQPMRHGDVAARVNYAHDSSYCGRCDYDLTGNESGICPECGWQIPETPEFIEPPHWAHWWKSWEIQYMEQWRKSLATCLFSAVFSLGMLVGFWVWLGEPSPVLILFLALGVNHLLLVVRIIAYARRQQVE
jgi:hypothetical protein